MRRCLLIPLLLSSACMTQSWLRDKDCAKPDRPAWTELMPISAPVAIRSILFSDGQVMDADNPVRVEEWEISFATDTPTAEYNRRNPEREVGDHELFIGPLICRNQISKKTTDGVFVLAWIYDPKTPCCWDWWWVDTLHSGRSDGFGMPGIDRIEIETAAGRVVIK